MSDSSATIMTYAPYLKQQAGDKHLEVVIIAGTLAWDTAKCWQSAPDREDDIPPVVLGPKELRQLGTLSIIRDDTLYACVVRAGDISEATLTQIMHKLALAGVLMARLLNTQGELLENWNRSCGRKALPARRRKTTG